MWVTFYFPNVDRGVINSLLKPLASLLGPRHAMFQYHMTWRYYRALIPFVTIMKKR